MFFQSPQIQIPDESPHVRNSWKPEEEIVFLFVEIDEKESMYLLMTMIDFSLFGIIRFSRKFRNIIVPCLLLIITSQKSSIHMRLNTRWTAGRVQVFPRGSSFPPLLVSSLSSSHLPHIPLHRSGVGVKAPTVRETRESIGGRGRRCTLVSVVGQFEVSSGSCSGGVRWHLNFGESGYRPYSVSGFQFAVSCSEICRTCRCRLLKCISARHRLSRGLNFKWIRRLVVRPSRGDFCCCSGSPTNIVLRNETHFVP